MRPRTMHVVTPTYRPAGGVVKLMDYATHALHAGFEVSVGCAAAEVAEDLPLFDIPRLREQLWDDPRVRYHRDRRLDVRPDDLVLVSLPSDVPGAIRSLPPGVSPERVIHLIQNVRHANPTWQGGFPTRLLTWPMARISLTSVTADVVAPYLDPRCLHEVIPLGHEIGFFAREPRSRGLGSPVRVGYTTWKSDLGDKVAAGVSGEDYTFRAIREPCGWDQLRDLYHWADVFLATPGPEEGFYMPGLEAMEAGCLLVTPDVGGNMAYCTPGDNCELVSYEDADAYVAALRTLTSLGDDAVELRRRRGSESVAEFSLTDERTSFVRFLHELDQRIARHESHAPSIPTTQ